MSKILKNITMSDVNVSDLGIVIPANTNYTINPNEYGLWMSSNNVVTLIGNEELVVNDGSYDLDIAQGIALVQGNFKFTDFVPEIKQNNRLKVDVLSLDISGPSIKVSSNDQTAGYLEQKIFGKNAKINVTTDNEGSNENIEIDIGSDVFDKTIDTAFNITNTPSGNISSTNVQGAINELDSEKQPLDSTLTALAAYNSNGLVTQTSADTFIGRSIQAGTGISVSNGNGVSGNPQVSLSNTAVSPGTYGSASQVGVFTVNAQGQITSANNANITVPIKAFFSLNNASPSTRDVKVYSGVIETTGSTVTFQLTNNGTDSGTALFSGLTLTNAVFLVSATRDTTSNNEAPWAYVRSVTNSGRTVTVGIKRSNTGVILLGGNYSGNENNGNAVTVHLVVIGVGA